MNEEMQNVQMTIDQAEAKISLAEDVEKLIGHPLFKKIITDGYLGDDAVRLTMNLKPEADKNEIINSMLTAKSVFSRHIAQLLEDGRIAMETLNEHRELETEISEG